MDHLQEKQRKKKARCGLHIWFAPENDTQKDVLHCGTCNVNLCTSCCKLFHDTHDLVPVKKLLCHKHLKLFFLKLTI